MLDIKYILAGAVVGLITSMTGIGGGSLMAPILILVFGIAPSTAVGTDLFFACITKSVSVYYYWKRKLINWKIVGLLLLGSIPTAILTLAILKWAHYQTHQLNAVISKIISIAIVVSTLLYLGSWQLRRSSFLISSRELSATALQLLTVLSGSIIGIVLTLTSVGAGVLGTATLMLIYPGLEPVRLIATEIAHAIPLALIAGIGHASLGNINTSLLMNLLIGSLPASYCGSRFANHLPQKLLRIALAVLLIANAVRLF
jgi:uncharacterized membrane protein YfcA